MDFGIIEFLSQSDKQKHILLSFLIFIFDFLIRFFLIQKKKKITYAGAFALRDTLFIGLLKEFIDSLGFGIPDFMDFVGDCIGFIFPIYLYFSYKEMQDLGKKNIFQYLDEYFSQIFSFLKIFKKETGEGIQFGFDYFVKYIKSKIEPKDFSKKELFLLRNKSENEIYEGISALKKMLKILKYFFLYLFFSILDFFIEIIKMPFFILFKTFLFIRKSFLIIGKSLLKNLKKS